MIIIMKKRNDSYYIIVHRTTSFYVGNINPVLNKKTFLKKFSH